MKFKTALTEEVKLIIYAVYDNNIEIDKYRNISIDY